MALIVLGAWDVFDLTVDGQKLSFGSSGWDAYFTSQLQRGIDILTGAGAQVAILDVPCYRPIESGGRRALPERRDDDRTRHLNVLFRQVAAQDPSHVFAIEDPPAFCTDDAIANDVYYRWDGVHYGGLGAKLMFNTITKPLLAIPRP
jgi:hypothetical protein